MYLKYSTCPPWYDETAMACASSSSAQVTISSTDRLCPRWITSHPLACRMRRMMLMDASWPSNRLAAVTKRRWRRGWVDSDWRATERSFITESGLGAGRVGGAEGCTAGPGADDPRHT